MKVLSWIVQFSFPDPKQLRQIGGELPVQYTKVNEPSPYNI